VVLVRSGAAGVQVQPQSSVPVLALALP